MQVLCCISHSAKQKLTWRVKARSRCVRRRHGFMADFDDYFGDDDFILDEAAEAALAETERQYATQAQQPVERPVPKRQRTTTGWTAGLGSRSDSYGDFDSYPEIIVQENGYQASARNEPLPPPPARPRVPAYKPPAPVRPNPPQRQPQRVIPTQQASGRASTSNYRPQVAERPLSVSHTPARIASPAPGPHPLESQLQELRQQLEEVRSSVCLGIQWLIVAVAAIELTSTISPARSCRDED